MDELLPPERVEYHEAYFQFGEDEPICFAYAVDEFSLTLSPEKHEMPTVVFSDGRGNEFKIFLKKRTHEL